MRRLAIACVVLAACSHLFGLDAVMPDDRDGDHWPDQIDNCPDDYNPDQSDVDHDGVGDRCQLCESPSGLDDDNDGIPNECDGCDNRLPDDNHDGVPDACEHLNDAGVIVFTPPDAACPLCRPCSVGPLHDEDGDEIADGCDDCPIFVSGSEAGDTDGDGVGDLCDVSPLPSHQVFDAFAEPNLNWLETGMWTVANDKVHVAISLGSKYRQLGTGASHFAIRTFMIAAGGPSGDANAGVMAARDAALDSPSFTEQLRCSLREMFLSTGSQQLELQQDVKGATAPVVTTLPLPPAAHYRIELDYEAATAQIRCTAEPDGLGSLVEIKATETDPSTDVWTTGLFSGQGGGTATFDYYEMATDD